ncbi:E3 ubiquitin-protein ligase HUWE1-like isoform X4 [Biomphalaria glabrata]|uniref:HECT-type E3 ubiquitin transferase n=1 Tax=Biomphalaria glabrata TaxID=6526 RepID=A0A9W3A5I7_BIOGL|nr:E3 ubiquitin-protein ligase HUWE1-like isoform X4 [Biomphalaria glabrata]
MKVDRSKLKKSSSEVPADCKVLIDKLKSLSTDDLCKELKDIKTWTYGKCELYHWADILDIFDAILEKSCTKENDKKWTLYCDLPGNDQLKQLLMEILRFTALLIEHSFSRHLYNSMDHLTTLLTSCDMSTVLYVLNLLYVFSKRSNFISRMNPEKKQGLVLRLIHLAESWGGKENGFGLAECCQDLPKGSYPCSATTLHFEFYIEAKDDKCNKKFTHGSTTAIQSIHMENVDKTGKMPSQIMEDILDVYDVPEEKKVLLFTHVRLACLFSNYEARVQCVQARLQAISILVYSSAIQENMNVILYPGLIEELVDIVEIKDTAIVDIKSAALRTLTSVIHIERNPRLNSIIDATGASSYHGFLPVLVRTCIQHMIDPDRKPFPQTYATSLFSFLYHLASYDNGVEALVSCGMMESLLQVINWYADGQEHITFVTRAVRVIDLITNMDMAAFQAHGGLQTFINRLEHEVNICRIEQPFVIRTHGRNTILDAFVDSPVTMDTSLTEEVIDLELSSMGNSAKLTENPGISNPILSECAETSKCMANTSAQNLKGKHCFAQRAALLKSMLNFMKKAIPDLSFAESIRHLMDGSLPKSLKHIISNSEYYGPSLFLLATDVVTVYVFQEPSLLSSLQDKGLTDVVLQALLIKDVPATREVLASLPNVFSALCLNARGLEAFVACKPFDRLFKVLLSPDYLPAMRRRRSSDTFGDTASNLGNAMDELMRHQPSLRTDATKAIIKLLEEICIMGQEPHFICQKQQPKVDQNLVQSSCVRSPQSNEASSSDEEEDEEAEMPHMPPSITASTHLSSSHIKPAVPSTSQQDSMQLHDRQAIPLMDYVLNVMKFVEAILSNNSTDDHCKEFVAQNGLKPLMSILGLPNLPIDFPSSTACQAVSSACKSVLTLSREPKVIKQGLLQMHEVLQKLEPLHKPLEPPGGSVLLHELANCAHMPDATLSPTATPLLHALAAAHAYIAMFVHVCRMGQTDIRTISIDNWGSDLGLEVLKGLSSLYNSLVWESTVLLALCNEDYLPADCPFGRADLDKLLSKDAREKNENVEVEASKESKASEVSVDNKIEPSGLNDGIIETGSNGVSVAMETLSTGDERMDTSEGHFQNLIQPGMPHYRANEHNQSINPIVTTSTSSTSIESDILPNPLAMTSGTEEKEGKKKVSPAMQAQLRQLKPLLTLSSRLGRALSELFVLLVKLCVGSPVRQRRSQQPPPTPPIPSPAARAVALALTKLLAGGLSFQPPPCVSQPKLRMTFLVCAAGFTAPMLFDEKKQPFHLMLQKFVSCGGQTALFQSFSWALSMNRKLPLSQEHENPELPEGTGEFLDSWLTLVEKMINPKAVLESPHTLPSKEKAPGCTQFNPVQYLISTQKAAFNAVMNLWNKKPLTVHGSRISESILMILCHIIDGEAKIKKYLEKDKEKSSGSSGDAAVDLSGAGPSGLGSVSLATAPSSASRRPLETVINQAHLQQLMDMGFTREQATVALNNTSNLEQATDYILTNPAPIATHNSIVGAMDVDLNDEDQMMRAIAMSLGENAVLSTDQTKPESKEEKQFDSVEEKQEAEEPLETAVLDEFTYSIFPGCLNLLDTLPETVYRVCDLLIVIMNRNGTEWKQETLRSLCNELCELCNEMTQCALETNVKAMQNSPSSQKFATRLHLLSLLAEEMNLACAIAMQEVDLPKLIVRLLQTSKDAMLSSYVTDTKITLKWLAPMLLLLDLWEKISVGLKRKMQARIAVGNNRVWKWFDDSSGRWCKYSSNNNATIDEAFRKGENFVRFQAGRRKYSVQFGTMIQLNEETGNRRPVMLSMSTAEEKTPGRKEMKENLVDEQLIAEIKKEFQVTGEIDEFLPGLNEESIETIISCLSAYLSIPLNSDTLHAAMRLILRITRQHKYAVKFVAENGAKRLLNLSLDSNFQGFLNLATLIFRHILEEPVALRYCMEKVMRNVCAGIGSCQSGVSQGGVGAKEMHYVLRVLGPAACRDPEMFIQVARDTLQIALPPSSLRDEDESRFGSQNTPQLLKCTPTKQLESLVNPYIKTFIWDLLNALIAEQPSKASKERPLTLAELLQDTVTESQSGNSTQFSWVIQCGSGSNSQHAGENGMSQGEKDSVAAGEGCGAVVRPLIPKSAILRLLSEIIRSYGNCVQLITQHNYSPGQTELVPESCSVLAFVLDSLLTNWQDIGDKDCPALSRVFIASIASCSHSPDAQMILVTEVKAALQRALVLPESSSKHQRIQALTSIINTMIESCPTPGQVPNQVFKGQQVINNNMMKILVKKGLLVDLARIAHSLDLSSPFLASTINAALKPLETLSRSVNSPDKFVTVKKSMAESNSTAPDQGGTTTQVVTEPAHASETRPSDGLPLATDINVTIEDVTNNPDAQLDLETSNDHHILEPNAGQEEELDNVLQQMFQSSHGVDPEDQVISEMTISNVEPTVGEDENEILIDVEVEGDEDDYEGHDSQMVSQVLSDEDDDVPDHRDRDDNQDDVSGDEEDYDEADQEEIGDDDEDDDDDDEEEDDDDDASDIDGDDDQGWTNAFETDGLVFEVDDFPTSGGGQHIIFNDSSQIQTYQLPMHLHENESGADTLPNLPPAPSNITSTHPLLMRQGDSHAARGHRGGRQRMRTLPTVHVNLNSTTRQPNTPVILQRLLGPSTAAEILQLTSNLGHVQGAGSSGGPRVVLAGENLPLISRAPDDDLFEEIFQEPYSDAGSSGTGALSCIPSTLTRWIEETKVLDGDGVHDLVLIVKPPLIEELVKKRDEELAERKEKRKKMETSVTNVDKKKDTEQDTKQCLIPAVIAPNSTSESNASQAAEILASAMVEHVFSPMVSQSASSTLAARLPEDNVNMPVHRNNRTPSINSSNQQVQQISATADQGHGSDLIQQEMLPLSSHIAPHLADILPSSSIPAASSMWPVTTQQSSSLVSLSNSREETRAVASSNQMQGSMISQLLDSIMTDQPFTPSSSSVLSTSSTTTVPTPLQLRHIPWHHDSQFSVPPTHFYLNPVTQAGTSAVSVPTTGVDLLSTSLPQSLAASSNISAPFDFTESLPPLPVTTTPLFSGLDLSQDLSSIFSHTHQSFYSGGVTGATPALSNLTFVTTTAPSVQPVNTVITTGATTTSTSGLQSQGISDQEIPEGVDPSFLAALPEHIRQEVISEQLRLQRIRRRAQEQAHQSASISDTGAGEGGSAMEVNAEFLAALPPAIQEEVLAQQRAEQARLAALQQNAANPDLPVDPATFFSTLSTSLRQQVLSDMDDSMLAVLPPELAAEAQELRRDMEERHRRLLQERLFAQAGAASISAILRHSGLAGRLGTRYAIRATQRQNQWSFGGSRLNSGPSGATNPTKVKGRFMLDAEALTCLLVLLFIDEPKLNTTRLHRVLRNLCYHGPTRAWLIRALLSIVQKAGDNTNNIANNLSSDRSNSGFKDKGKGKKSVPMNCTVPVSSSSSSATSLDTSLSMQSDVNLALVTNMNTSTPLAVGGSSSGGTGYWLSISLEAALGCRANVFQIQHKSYGKKSSSSSPAQINIHPQAAPVVCRHALDTLISLAKIFPTYFLPAGKVKEVNKCEGPVKDEETDVTALKKSPHGALMSSPKAKPTDMSAPTSTRHDMKLENDFWNILVRLDSTCGKSKGKNVQRSHNITASEFELLATDYANSALGQLMSMLNHPVVKRSQLLTDRLLRLLGLISVSLPDNTRPSQTNNIVNVAAMRSNVANPPLPGQTAIASSSGQTSNQDNQDGSIKEAEIKENLTSLETETEQDEVPILYDQLKLAVEVLTSKSCSEEGLEDATNLLLQLSWANTATRAAVLELLLSGARQLGMTVCSHINSLLEQLKELNSGIGVDQQDEDSNLDSSDKIGGSVGSSQHAKGVLQDRFTSGASIIVSVPAKLKTGRELQLPSMSQLTSKTSGQQFFLRILKVIIQLRDAARTAGTKHKKVNGRDVPTSSQSQASQGVEDNSRSMEMPMEVDTQAAGAESESKFSESTSATHSAPTSLPRLSEQLGLEELWNTLGNCLAELARTPDHHAVLILQPAVEAFFIVHAGEKGKKTNETPVSKREDQLAHLNMEMAPPSPSPGPSCADGPLSLVGRENSGIAMASITHLPPDTQKFLKFAETHRTVLNQILRQSTLPLAEGPFSVLVDYTRILDFDVKRRYFRQELERMNEGARREDLPVHARRSNVFEDSFRELFRRTPEEWKQRFYIVFEGEEGQDAGGLLREWYIIISHEIFNQNYALFLTSPGDRVTYSINPSSHCNSNHLSYFKFVGRIIAKAVYDNKLLDCYFTRSFYKHMLGLPVKYTDMESEDYAFYQGLVFLLENNVADLGYDIFFSTEIQEFGVTETRELIANGSNVLVTDENKREYVKLVCQMKMTGAIRQQLNAFLEGFYDIIPKKLVSIFTEQELELLISGLPTIDIDDLKANTEYHKYQATSLQIQWFWRALRSFDQAERANFLQFVTGTSKVPLGGFGNLEGMNGTQKFQIHRDDRSTDRLPSAHTCFNQLDLPAYETYDKLRKMLLLAISECSEGFGLA